MPRHRLSYRRLAELPGAVAELKYSVSLFARRTDLARRSLFDASELAGEFRVFVPAIDVEANGIVGPGRGA